LKGYFNKRGYEDSAEIGLNSISGLPRGAPVKSFTFTAKQLFDGRDSAKLKDQKSLDAAGEFLAQNQFGVAVVVASTGIEGDTQKDLLLTEARAMVVREYLAGNFRFNNDLLKTLGMGNRELQTWMRTGVRSKFSFSRPGRKYRPPDRILRAVHLHRIPIGRPDYCGCHS